MYDQMLSMPTNSKMPQTNNVLNDNLRTLIVIVYKNAFST